MNKIIQSISFLILLCFSIQVQAQDTLKAQQLYIKGLTIANEGGAATDIYPFLNEAIEIYAKSNDKPFRLKMLSKAILVANQYSDFKQMKAYLDLMEPLYLENPLLTEGISFYNYKGAYYSSLSNFDQALDNFLRYEAILKQYLKEKNLPQTALGAVYNNIATVYGEKLDRKNAEAYFNKALELNLELKNYEKVAINYMNIAILYWDDPVQKLKNLRKSLSMLGRVEAELTSIRVNTKMAEAFLQLKDIDSAKVYLLKNIASGLEEDMETTYLTLGRIYIQEKNYEKASAYVQKALLRYNDIYGTYHKHISECYELLANIEGINGNKTKALDYVRKGIQAVCLGFDPLGDALPKIDMVLDASQLVNVLTVYQGFVPVQKAFEIAELNFVLVEAEAKGTHTDDNQKEVLKFNYTVYEKAIKTALALEQLSSDKAALESALKYMEASRAQLLMNMLYPSSKTAEQDSILQEGTALAAAKNKLLHKAFEHLNYEEFDAAKAAEQSISELKQKQLAWQERLQKYRPALYRMKYDRKQLDLAAVQNSLKTEDCLLEYFVGEDSVYALVITAKTAKLMSLGLSKVLNSDIKLLYSMLNAFPKNDLEAAQQNYRVVASDFFVKWVKPLIQTNSSRLIVVPDGALAYIPFEALLTEVTDKAGFKELPYLIKKYGVHYRYAAGLDMKEQSKAIQNEGTILAFAPSYTKQKEVEETNQSTLRANLAELPGAREEVEMLFKKFRGSFYFGNEAGEARFKKLEKTGHYAIIHFAMHGIVNIKDPSNSGLVFTNLGEKEEDDFLQANEIINMRLNANLVVLSACETGFGKYEHGEGVLSLGRSFMFAGVPAVVSTLWQLNDVAGNRIMMLFYELLSKGYSVDEALRQAKLVFLNEVEDIAAHPNLWASFVSIGDDSPIKVYKKSFIEQYWFYGMLIVFTILGIVIFVWRINQLTLGRQGAK